MGRSDLERLSKQDLIELVLRLQRPEKTLRTSSKPPSTDRKEQRERSKPGGAKPGHEGHGRIISDTPDEVVEHRPGRCSCCAAVLMADLPSETVSIHEQVDLPEVKPLIMQHLRLQGALSDLFGLTLSQGGLMNLLRRAQGRFAEGQVRAVSSLSRAEVVASDETGVRIEGSNAYHGVFRSPEAVLHHASPTRAAS